MDSTSTLKVTYEFLPLLRIFEDGSVERLLGTATVPPSLDQHPTTSSKDVIFSPKSNLISRLYIPKSLPAGHKVPLLIYFHGGGFCLQSAFAPEFHTHLNRLAAQANALVVSVNYRKAPENPLPAAYDDAWEALKWVASHSAGDGPEEWVNEYADLRRVFFAGDSAGGNIAHNLAVRCGVEKVAGVDVVGLVAVQPFFGGEEPIDGETPEMREYFQKVGKLAGSIGFDDPVVNPAKDPNLSKMGCRKVLIFVGGSDELAGRNWLYYETLKKSGWNGKVEIFECKDEGHVFHIFFKPDCENALALMKKFSSFVNEDIQLNH